MSLEEPKDADAEGLKLALENSIEKLELTIDRSEHEIGICSDGAAVNPALYRKVKAEIGDHYIHVWCPAHCLELGIKDAFHSSAFNSKCEETSNSVYYLFKKATLRWRLFKRQASFLSLPIKKYKRPNGTRWVEHQVDYLQSYNFNLPVFIAFLNQQISQPHNASMRKIKSTLEGIRNDLCNVDVILFNAAKQDVLSIIQPFSKILQDKSLLCIIYIYL